ncbi:sulfite exporter TauE/SafE family protein [Patescibacteria group bacterium]|nr:sulfite exporter TauE/SafE family protein [Patescibacteria group bacterium]
METKKFTYFVRGMHCASCQLFVESNLMSEKNIQSASCKLSDGTVTVEMTGEELLNLDKINEKIKGTGYFISKIKLVKEKKTNYGEIGTAFFIALIFILFFFIFQKLGFLNFFNFEKMNFTSIFLIGILASLSSCSVVVGSVFLSFVSSLSKNGKGNYTSLTILHVTRLISFFVLGGILGIVGNTISINLFFSSFLNVLVIVVMTFLGLGMLEISPKKFSFSLPYSKKFTSILFENKNGTYFSAIIIGALTFFLPCGFTQSIQIVALGTKDFLQGALTMFFFSLGTFPVLFLISFLGVEITKKLKSKIFFKTAGFIILFFSLISLFNILKTF